MVDLGLFRNSLFGEALFNQPIDGILLAAVGDSEAYGAATVIFSAQGTAVGDSAGYGAANAVFSALGSAVGDSEAVGIGTRIRYFPARTGLRVQRWGGTR